MDTQPMILAAPPPSGLFLTLTLARNADVREARTAVANLPPDDNLVLGLGEPFLQALGCSLDGLHAFRSLVGPGGAFPSTQGDLWIFLGGPDAGTVLHRARALTARLAGPFTVVEETPSFVFDGGRDLSGYEDGTENPKDSRAVEVAVIAGDRPGISGGSFVAIQRWVHDLSALERMSPKERDHVMGREVASNQEIADAPVSAHVKRTAQESFDPEAFMVRRSMPWGDRLTHGLYFVAYGNTLDPFERVLSRMAGLEDGVPDALLRFTRPVTGGCIFCPPLRDGRLDLRILGA